MKNFEKSWRSKDENCVHSEKEKKRKKKMNLPKHIEEKCIMQIKDRNLEWQCIKGEHVL